MSEELRAVRDTLIEELRRTEKLTVAGRALFARYAAMSEAENEAQAEPVAAAQPAAQPVRRRPAPAEEDDEFGGSFMVRNNPVQPPPGYQETPQPGELPRSLRHRRR